jgi:hypothetical protein
MFGLGFSLYFVLLLFKAKTVEESGNCRFNQRAALNVSQFHFASAQKIA